jgi:argininosuccinate synthase
MSTVKKVVLAYSGGLDTSIIIPWIKENYGGAEIIAYCGDVGQGDDLEAVRKKALATGASKCIVKDLRDEFVRDYCYKALAAGAVYEDRYLLGTALARPLIAYHQVQAAIREGADALAHGATGKGNDQVRFEVTFAAFAPHMTVIAPWREWNDPLAGGRARLRPQARRAGRPDEEGPLQPRRQSLAPLARGRQPRGRVGRPAEGHVQAHRRPARCPCEAAPW